MASISRLSRRAGWLGAALFAATVFFSQAVNANSCPPGPGPVSGDRVFTVTTGTCIYTGAGNNTGASADAVAFQNFLAATYPGYPLLETVQTSDAGTGGSGSLLTFTINAGSNNDGTWAISQPGNYILVLKTGTGQLDPDFAAFTLTGLSGTFSIDPTQASGLSHVSLYGQVIPLPPALLLMMSGLAGLGLLGRRRRNKATA